MLDALIREAADTFSLGHQARPFIGGLLSLIFDERTGGFAGLQKRFGQAGFGDQFRSWIGTVVGDNVLQPDQFATVVGSEAVAALAAKIGAPRSAVTIAGATLLPKLIGLLTRHGPVTQAPREFQALIGEYGAGSAAVAAAVAPATAGGGGSWWKWLLPLLVLGALLLLYRSCGQVTGTPAASTPPPAAAPTAPATAPAATPAATPAAAPAALTAPSLSFENTGGQVKVGGQLADQGSLDRLLAALRAAFGADNVRSEIKVDAATAPATWLDRFIAALPELKFNGLKLWFDNDKLRLDTSGLPEADRFSLSTRLRNLFSGFEISGLWDRAASALAALRSGFSGQELVQALNLSQVHFDTGSATITRDSQETLAQAAKAIKAAPAGTRIELGGHTDNTGDAAVNLTLSEQRAQAVAASLVAQGVSAQALSVKGYGQEKPVASNDTEEGRAQNRRIVFTVLN